MSENYISFCCITYPIARIYKIFSQNGMTAEGVALFGWFRKKLMKNEESLCASSNNICFNINVAYERMNELWSEINILVDSYIGINEFMDDRYQQADDYQKRYKVDLKLMCNGLRDSRKNFMKALIYDKKIVAQGSSVCVPIHCPMEADEDQECQVLLREAEKELGRSSYAANKCMRIVFKSTLHPS